VENNIQAMKNLIIFTMTLLSLSTFGQDKYNYVHFNKLTEVTGTEFVIASIENWGKMMGTNGQYLLFINTKSGETTPRRFPG
jgi:hypothetical protein